MLIRLLKPLAGLLACATALILCPSAATARTVTAQLRVEGPGVTLDPGTYYVTGSAKVDRGSSSKCRANGRQATIQGPTALGILAPFSRLDPDGSPLLARTDSSTPGLLLCRVGAFKANQGFTKFWSYWVNNVPPSISADTLRLHGGDHVLWTFGVVVGGFGGADDTNTGDVLTLKAPPAAEPGQPFEVTVRRHPFFGDPSPASGAMVSGGDAPAITDASGHADITISDQGNSALVATNRPDVPSNRVRVCVDAQASRCPTAHGKRIVGSPRADRIHATRGWDRIRARGGDDVVDLRAGGRDRVGCGPGRDRVLLEQGDHDDRIAASCERVVRR